MIKAEWWRDVAWVIGGNAITAAAYSWFLVRLNLLSGGVTASAMIAAALTPLSVTWWSNVITLACLGLSWWGLGRQVFANSVLSSVAYMGWFSLFQTLPSPLPAGVPAWVAVVAAALGVGVGYYFCIAHHASTAGLDVLALIVHQHRPSWSVSALLRGLNLLVLGVGAWVFGGGALFYGILFIIGYTGVLGALQKRYNESAELV